MEGRFFFLFSFFLVVSLIGVEEEEEKMMEPIFFSCFPLTSIWKITCEKDEISLGEETKGALPLFGFFFARKVMGKRRRGKRLRRHFAIKPRKEGGQKGRARYCIKIGSLGSV